MEPEGLPSPIPASLCNGEFTTDELAAAVKVMTALGSNEEEYITSSTYKSFRGALVPLIKHTFGLRLQKKAAEGEKNVKAHERRRVDARRRAQERNLLDTRAMRASRIDQLKALMKDDPNSNHSLLRIPDGPAVEGVGGLGGSRGALFLGTESDAGTLATNVSAMVPPLVVEPAELEFSEQSCYVCKARYHEIHAFYATLCPSCAGLNWAKRNATCDLTGRYAVLTGGRIKVRPMIALIGACYKSRR